MPDWFMDLLYAPPNEKGYRKNKILAEIFGPSEEATDWSFKMFPQGSSSEGDQRDVARHLMGAALNTQKYGKWPTLAAGAIRELPPLTLNNLYDTQEGWNDHHNNIVGANLAQKAKSREELERMVLEYVANARKGTAPLVGGKERAYFSGIPNKKTIYDF